MAERFDIERLEQEIRKADVAAVRADLKIAIRDIKIWLGSLIIVTGGALFAALHYWPPK